MAADSSTVYELLFKADRLTEESKFHDAERVYEAALKRENYTANELLEIKLGLGTCLALSGKLFRALSCISEVYEKTKDTIEHSYFAVNALNRKISILQKIHKVGLNLPPGNSQKIFDFIKQGRQWLCDIGEDPQEAGIILSEADLFFSLNDISSAYTLAKKSYEQAKSQGSRFRLHDHARTVARNASLLGKTKRVVQVIDEIKGLKLFGSPLSEARCLRVQIEVLSSMNMELSKLIPTARRMCFIADNIQGAKNRVFLYAVFAGLALEINYFDEAGNAIRKAQDLAMEDDTNYRHFLLRELKVKFLKMQQQLMKNETTCTIHKLQKLLDVSITEIDHTLQVETA